MIITRTPFRISFCGGGSDLPSFYEKYGGCVLSTSINKYMYISIHPYFYPDKTHLKYSQNELVDNIDNIKHTIFNCVLNEMGVEGVEITSTADVPAGTGLGSSSAFTVGLLHTLYSYKGKYRSKADLAKQACEIEIDKLKSPIGKQDQYAAALGGLNYIHFDQDGTVNHVPIMMKANTYKKLQKNLIMFYLGTSRVANDILSQQNKNMDKDANTNALLKMCELTREMKTSLEKNDLSGFGSMLHENWKLKQSLASGITDPKINEIYEKGINAGASGGKLLGAGGGGFMLFYCETERQEGLCNTLGLKPLDFSFERDGTSVIYIGDKYWE